MIYRNSIIRLANYFEYNLFSYAGVQEDRANLISQYPNQEAEIKSLQDKYIKWLALRFGEVKSMEETHPLQDCIPTLLKYQAKEAGISQKYRQNEEFKNLVDSKYSPESRGWSNPADILKISVDQMEDIANSAAKPKKKVEGLGDSKSYSLPEEDRIGKVGEWNLWLPTSRENSCKIAGYDPVTMQPYTTWCTARTSGSNLFYNYMGGSSGRCILFYVIKDNPQADQDWLSVGFLNGKPYLIGQSGGLSVDRANVGLTQESLRSILGGSYDQIIATLQQKSDSLGGASPVFSRIEAAAKDPKLFSSLISGNTAEEADMIINEILPLTESVEVLSIAFDKTEDLNKLDTIAHHHAADPALFAKKMPDRLDKIVDKTINKLNQQSTSYSSIELLDKIIKISKMPNILPVTANKISKILIILAKHEDANIRIIVAKSESTPPEVLTSLAMDKIYHVRMAVATNTNAPSDVLIDLAEYGDDYVKMAVANNINTPPDTLTILSGEGSRSIRGHVAGNMNTPPDTLITLAQDKDSNVRMAVTKNINVPPKALTILASDKVKEIRWEVANSKDVPLEALIILAKDEEYHIRRSVAVNNNASTEILVALAEDGEVSIREGVARNINTPPEVLTRLAKDVSNIVREEVAKNVNTPPEVLTTLKEDQDYYVSLAAYRNSSTPKNKTAHLLYRINLFYKKALATAERFSF